MKRLYDQSFAEFYEKQFPHLVADPAKQNATKPIVARIHEITRPTHREDVFQTFSLPSGDGATTLTILAAIYVGGMMKIPTSLHIEGQKMAGTLSLSWKLSEMLIQIGLDPGILEPYSDCVCLSSHVFTARRPILFCLDDRHPLKYGGVFNHSVITIAKRGDQRWDC